MGRALRVQVAGGIYHVTARAARGGYLFPGAPERDVFEDVLMIALPAASLRCHAYCLMGTHYHLVLRTTKPNIGAAMKRLNWLYSWRFNRRYGTRGHLFESRYSAVLVESDEHYVAIVRYLALNPITAGLCASAESWPWSSYAATVGDVACPVFLEPASVLQLFHRRPALARRALREFVEARPVAA